MCQKCSGQGYFASPLGFCVQSSDSCGIFLPKNSTYLGYFSNFDKSFYSLFDCSNKIQQNCTDHTCQQCGISYQLKASSSTIINLYASKNRAQCVQTYQSCSSTSNFTDSHCQVCNQNSKFFESLDELQYIKLLDSCNSSVRKPLWIDTDCQKCKKGQYATFDKKSCSKIANCSSQKAPFNDDFCQQCSQGQQYASIDGAHCLNIKHSCKCTGVYWKEEECSVCYYNKQHAYILGTSCGQSLDLCQNRESQLTDKDCKLCYTQKHISTNELGTQFIDLNCKKITVWTEFECFRCNSLKPKASANNNSCTA
ncbi:hypothetical protein ABPG72_004770 [Tetrahymena utriculariae]